MRSNVLPVRRRALLTKGISSLTYNQSVVSTLSEEKILLSSSSPPESPPDTPKRSLHLLVPTGGAIFFAYMLFLFLACRPLLLLGDGGTCRHIVTGQWIFQHLAIPTTNYVFALAPNAPWITHELLADLLLAGSNQLFGLNGVVLLSASVICLILTWTYQLARARGMGTISGLLALIVIMSATSIHWSARAHLFSYVPFMLIYFLVFEETTKSIWRYIAVAAIMAFWANLHGSFILGLLMIALKFTADLVCAAVEPPAQTESERTDSIWKGNLITLAVGVVGAALNVRGFNFFAYVVSYATNPLIRFHSEESRSIDFMVGMPVFAFLILFASAIFLWAFSRKPPKFADFILVLTFFMGGIYAMRIIPYFAIIILPSIGESWLALRTNYLWGMEASTQKNPIQKLIAKVFAVEARLDQNETKSFRSVWKIYALTAAFVLGWLLLPFSKITDFDPERLPVNALNFMKDKYPSDGKPAGLGFNPDNWGDYLYLKTHKPVFIDDKGDFYDASFTNKYITLFSGGEGFRKLLDEFNLEWILAPNSLPMVSLLSNDPDWKVAYHDELVTLLLKQKVQADEGKTSPVRAHP